MSRRRLLQLSGAGILLQARIASAQQATPSATLRQHIDPDWFRKALSDEIEHWHTAAELPSGFVQPRLDRQWRPVGEQIATLTSQGRHMFMRARGYDLTRNPAYLQSVRRIADYTLANFRDARYGGLVFGVSPEGKIVDDHKDSYGTAFAIFGLSHAVRVTRDERYRRAAFDTWADMKKNLEDQAGFYKPRTTRDYGKADGTSSQNPLMHLFEALLALYDATGSKDVRADANALANAIFTKLFQANDGYLPELYDAGWKPLPERRGGHSDLGHQFEWAFLWSQAVDRGFPRRGLHLYGERLLRYGMKVAYDTDHGGIFSVGVGGHPIKAPKGLWQQCEFLRALMNYAEVHNHQELWAAFDKSLGVFKQNFMDARYGGCFSTYYDPTSPPDEARLGKDGIDSYHVCGMYSEALRLAGC